MYGRVRDIKQIQGADVSQHETPRWILLDGYNMCELLLHTESFNTYGCCGRYNRLQPGGHMLLPIPMVIHHLCSQQRLVV